LGPRWHGTGSTATEEANAGKSPRPVERKGSKGDGGVHYLELRGAESALSLEVSMPATVSLSPLLSPGLTIRYRGITQADNNVLCRF